MGPPSFSVDLSWSDSWPLYTVYPLSTLLFVGLYFSGPKFWPQLVPYYEKKMGPLGKKCWQQNTCALMHCVVLCPLLLAAILSDPEMRRRPLHPHHNLTGYVALCWSLGYFTFTIPWSLHLYCVKGERHATNLPLCIHHIIVWIAAITYLIARTSALYGAVGFAAMEFTNWFFIAHILQQQVRSRWYKLWNVNYLVLVFVGVIGMRLFLCTYMFVLFSIDISTFDSSSPAEMFFVVLQYIIFACVVVLSWVFIWNGIKDAGLDKLAMSKLGLDKSERISGSKTGIQRQSSSTSTKPGKVVRTSSNSSVNSNGNSDVNRT